MELFSITEAAKALGVWSKTVSKWLDDDGIAPSIPDTDKRTRTISYVELLDLAHRHKREVRLGRLARTGTDTLDTLAAIEQLQRRVALLEHEVTVLRRDVPERLLRAAGGAIPARGPRMDEVNAMIQQAVRLINETGQEVIPRRREILITFQGREDLFELAPLLRSEWQLALTRAMERGWKVAHLIRETDDLSRSLTIAEDMLRLLSGPLGAYLPLYTPASRDARETHCEFVLVPGIGALEVRVAADGASLSWKHHDPTSPGYQTASAWTAELRESGRSLVERFPAQSVRFNRAIVEAERTDGHRVVAMNGLSELTVPYEILTARAERLLRQGEPEVQRKVRGLLRTHQEREAVFSTQVLRWDYLDLCPMSAIQEYMRSGWHAEDDVLRTLGADNVARELRAEHVRDVIRRMRRYPRYRLGLLPEGTYDPASLRTFWLVKQGKVVLLEAQTAGMDGNTREMDLRTSEKRLVDAFYEYFYRLWARAMTDGAQVRAWLEAVLDEIPPRGMPRAAELLGC